MYIAIEPDIGLPILIDSRYDSSSCITLRIHDSRMVEDDLTVWRKKEWIMG
jgi:hypothetical protein